MAVYIDQLNRRVDLPAIPKRIISVVPSQTELLFYLGLDEEVIGITKFCIHPESQFKLKVKVGGTKQLNIKLIKDLKPDLIIANKEENEQSQIEALMQICPVWISDISNLEEAYDMIKRVGALIGKSIPAKALVNEIKSQFSQLNIPRSNLHVAYFIWRKPYMAAGRQTFIDDMLSKCGLVNVFEEGRYPQINEEKLKALQPDVVLLSSEPYPFARKHIKELKELLPKSNIILVDGELFSWYGSRLLHAAVYFKQLIENITPNQ